VDLLAAFGDVGQEPRDRARHQLVDLCEIGRGLEPAGKAFDGRATDGTGIDGLEVWAYPDDGTSPIYLGHAETGSGSARYELAVRPMAAGGYTLAVFGRSTVTGTYLPAATVHIVVR